jgi:hypothetical protein
MGQLKTVITGLSLINCVCHKVPPTPPPLKSVTDHNDQILKGLPGPHATITLGRRVASSCKFVT